MTELAVVEVSTGELSRGTLLAGEILVEDGAFKQASLTLPEDLSYEDWAGVGQVIQRAEKAVMWWIGDWLNYGEGKYGEMYSQAMDASSYSYSSLANAKFVSSKVEIAFRKANLSFSHHLQVASLSKEKQADWLEQAESEGLSVAELKSAIKFEARNNKLAEISAGNEDLEGNQLYNVIYADPPWRYEFSKSDSREIENQYPTMELEEICDLPVDELAAEHAVLYMWTTSPKLEESFQVLMAWGFEYKTCAIWDKQKIGMGYYFRQQHEILLVATKGELPAPLPEHRTPSVISVPRGKHSAKPHELYEILEAMYQGLSKIELFCRTPREGWAVWGNQSG